MRPLWRHSGSTSRLYPTNVPPAEEKPSRPACPVCGGRVREIRAKVCCTECRAIIETCCD